MLYAVLIVASMKVSLFGRARAAATLEVREEWVSLLLLLLMSAMPEEVVLDALRTSLHASSRMAMAGIATDIIRFIDMEGSDWGFPRADSGDGGLVVSAGTRREAGLSMVGQERFRRGSVRDAKKVEEWRRLSLFFWGASSSS